MKPPLGAQDVIIKTLLQSFGAFVRLFSCFQWICSIVLAREGDRGIIGSAYTGHGRTLAEIRRYWYQCSFCELLTLPIALELDCASAAGGRLYTLRDAAEY